MSNEIALIRFPNGVIKFSGYHGCGSNVNPYMVHTLDEVCEYAFSDSELNAIMDSADNYAAVEAFYDERDKRVYDDCCEVEIYTPYGGGIYWAARASLSAMTITAFTSDDDTAYQDGIPDWAKATGVPDTYSLVRSKWPVHLPLTILTTDKGPSY